MRINARAAAADRRQASKGHRMPGKLDATKVRVQALSMSQIKLNRRNSRTHSGKQIRPDRKQHRRVRFH